MLFESDTQQLAFVDELQKIAGLVPSVLKKLRGVPVVEYLPRNSATWEKAYANSSKLRGLGKNVGTTAATAPTASKRESSSKK